MAAYGKKTIKELQALCRQRGLDHKLRKKADLIDQLVMNDLGDQLVVNDSDNSQDDEVEICQRSVTNRPLDKGKSDESDTIVALRLQLEIERVKLQNAQLGVSQTAAPERTGRSDLADIRGRLPIMSAQGDIIAFFSCFERTLQLNNIPQECYAKLLPPCLNEKAAKIFAQQTLETCQSYEATRANLIEAFKATPETYWHKLNTSRRVGSESYKLFLSRLAEYQSNYITARKIGTFEELLDDYLLQVFLGSVPDSVAQFVKARQPSSAKEAAEAADLCYAVQPRSQNSAKFTNQTHTKNFKHVQSSTVDRDANSVSTVGQNNSESAKLTIVPRAESSAEASDKRAKLRCWTCKGPHKASACPSATSGSQSVQQANKNTHRCGYIQHSAGENHENRFIIPLLIENRGEAFVGYRDTGAQISLAHESIVDKTAYTGRTVEICGILGPKTQVPLAVIRINSPKFKFKEFVEMEVAVVSSPLPYDVDCLIGNSFYRANRNIKDLIQIAEMDDRQDMPVHSDGDQIDRNAEVVEKPAVVTRSQSRLKQPPTDNKTSGSIELSQTEVESGRREKAGRRTVASDDDVTHVCSSDLKGAEDSFAVRPAAKCQSEVVKLNDALKPTTDIANSLNDEQSSSVSVIENRLSQACANDLLMTGDLLGRSDVLRSRESVNINRVQDTVGRTPTHAPAADGRLLDSESETRVRVQMSTDGSKVTSVNSESNDGIFRSTVENSESDEMKRLACIDPSAINEMYVRPCMTDKQTDFAQLQRADSSLQQAWAKAKMRKSGFFIRNGLLMKSKPNHLKLHEDDDALLVLPRSCYAKVLEKAHDSLEGGCHFGFKRTARNISKVFYMNKSCIKRYVASCAVCQRLAPKRVKERAELVQIPVIDLEFGDKWVVDVSGGDFPKLSPANGGYKYILVACDVATRFVILIPLTKLRATSMADAITTHILARFGTKTTLVYDMQSSMLSEIFQKTLKLLRVTSRVAIAGYHSSTALAERWIRTVQKCLKSYIFSYKSRWNHLLPWVSFNLNQTAGSLFGFSPHELIFGRNFNNVLDDLKDEFIGESDEDDREVKRNVLSYLTDLRSRLAASRAVANQHASEIQAKTKQWYDRQCTKSKQFQPGAKVIVLEPDDSRKLFARWSEPMTVSRQTNERNYEVILPDGRKKIFHINQLRRFNDPVEFIHAVVITAEATGDEEDENIQALEDRNSEMDFKIETSLPPDKRERLLAVLNEYKDVFRKTLGKTHLATHVIKLKDTIPCVKPYYRIPEMLKPKLEDEINRLLSEGIIRECESDYCSPIIPIKKPDGSLRIVQDLSALNAKTVDDLYPMSSPNEVLSAAAGKPWISKLDLSQAYFQIPLASECQELTAFQCHLGTYCWTRTPQGAKNAPRTMERLLKSLLKGTSKFANSLLDDIVVSSDSFDDHLVHLAEILKRLRQANLTASISKSEFLKKSLTVLGHCIENGVITPSQTHIERVLKIGPQKTKAGVRAIIGLINYHHNMIPNLAAIMFPLTLLLKRNAPEKVKWQQEHTDALEWVKSILVTKPVLFPPKHDRHFIIMADSSDKTIGAILAQCDDHGVERNVAYFSKKLLPRQVNYGITQKECYAVVASVIHWHQYIYGHKILVRSDHASLRYLSTAAKHNAMLARWHILLSNYDITFEYRRAALHSNADGLSRIETDD
jgi:hypothetical protein